MPVGELFLSAFLSVLFDRLTSFELLQFLRQEGLYSKTKKWETTLKMIQAVLGDAEDKQLTNGAVKMWLDDLRDLAYDVEDLLDEFATEALARKSKMEEHDQQASTSKVRKLLPVRFGNWSPRAIKFNRSMESAIKDVTSRLEGLCGLREQLGLREIAGGISSSTAAVHQRPSTTSLRTEPAVYGRDQDKAKVIEMVLKDEPRDANFRVIPIVGMGGIGKTTLAREVYNDNQMMDFKPRAWVCISEDFDVLRISNAILGSMTSSSCDYKELDIVQIKLKEVLIGKKFLIVLDDVWSKDYNLWERLKSPFMAGAQGSKIIVTTRLVKVASMMNPGECYELKLLSNDNCWSLFMSHAFGSRDITTCCNIELIRKKVIQNCKGLPLAAKALGGLLRSEQSEDDWLEILNSKLWELSDETEIPMALKLSYFHLPFHLKRCFAYCAILPKDYEFEKEELVYLWMAEGFLQNPKRNKQLEDIGHEYFDDLLSRSIFQQSSIEKCNYVLHDLVSDLAQWASGDTCFSLDDISGANTQRSNLEKVRHFSYVSYLYDCKSKLEVFSQAKQVEHLRTFLPVSRSGSGFHYMPRALLFGLIPKFKKLRVLNLRNHFIYELPRSFDHLKYLRYLDISYTFIRSLPESTSSFSNLQLLKLRNCSHIRKLPSKMRNLINLRHLDIRDTNLIEMPVGMQELKCLQQLTDFIVGKGSGAEVTDLRQLQLLRGELCISKLENVMHLQELEGKILKDMKAIKVLQLKWASQFDEMRNEVIEKHVLDILEPHRNLEELTIKCYNGTEFPSWLGDSVFSKMTVLRLENCEKCISLPSFGRLGSLKELTIKGLKGLKCISYELYGEGCLKPFQLLETLCFEDLQEWELWEPIKENEHAETFPRLRKLSIVKCPKLSGKLPDDLSSLQQLVIKECAELVVSFYSLPVLCELEIDGCDKIACNGQVDFKSLESMTLSSLSDYGKWFSQRFEKDACLEKAPQQLQSFTLLRRLCIENCSNLVSFHEVCFLSSLAGLEIRNCNALTSLPDGMKHDDAHLDYLVIEQCSSLTFIIKGQPPPSLRWLDVKNCEKLECVFDDKDESRVSSMPHNENTNDRSTSLLKSSLDHIRIEQCSSLTFIIKGQPPPSLRWLDVKNCEKLECVFDDKDESRVSSMPHNENANDRSTSLLKSSLDHIRIEHCSQLTTIYSSGQLPERLRSLDISYAPKLESLVERFHGNMNLETFQISDCNNLKCIPEGLDNLSRLQQFYVRSCPNIVCFPEGGLPNTNLSVTIEDCEKLEALPSGFHCLDSLRGLRIGGCSSIKSFTEKGFPTNLTSLGIGNHNMYKALVEWGLHKLTSLIRLDINDCPDEELGVQLPPTLTHLYIKRCPNLKYLSSKGFQNLTRLEYLFIYDCPNLTSFPKQGLPSSLLRLSISGCPLLKKKYKKNKAKEWSKISHISYVRVDGGSIYHPGEEDLP